MNNKTNLTILLLTYNEVNRLEQLLERYTQYCEVILLDNFSTDGTLDIAKKFNVKIVSRVKNGVPTIDDYINGVNNTKNEWIHIGSCSEILSNRLLKKIVEISSDQSSPYSAISIKRVGYTWGVITHSYRAGVRKRSNEVQDCFRFLKKSVIDWGKARIHYETPATLNNSQVFYFDDDDDLSVIQYFRDGAFTAIESKHSQYADLEAKTMLSEGVKFSWVKLIFSPPKHFFVMFFARPNLHGFICAIQHSQLIMNIHLRLLANKKFDDDLNLKNNQIRNYFLNKEK
jgi:glycosyltransferase involved in cell wall biosynthesis